MKPIKIIMSAFGSYADKTEVSFENVNSGIFLIAGDTGAGKTTIFDAITYALYEQTSGGVRDGNMMRSQFADDDTETYVDLTFNYQGSIYRIRRNPQYERRSKRGTGFTTESPKVEFMLPDGKVFMGNKTETNNKITEILGIDREQFTQIAMIAQGDFLKLLHANSDERKRIFSKIFDTRVYNKIQDALRNKEKEITAELAKNKTLCEHEIKNVVCMDDSIYKELWTNMFFNFEFKMDEILELLDKIKLEISDKEQAIILRKEECQKSLNDINAAIANAETVNSIFNKLNYANEVKLELEKSFDLHEKNKKRLDCAKMAERVIPEENKYTEKLSSLKQAGQRIVSINNWLLDNEKELDILAKQLEECEKNKSDNESELTQNIAKINETLNKYDELDSKRAVAHDIENEKNTIEQSINALKKEVENKKIQKLKLENEQATLKNCYQIYTEKQLNVKDLEKKVLELEELNKQATELSLLKDSYDISIDKANVALKNYTQKNEIYEELYRSFLSEQAGILAKERLIIDKPCPVCGSTNHPCVAIVSEHAPTQLDVENAKKERDKSEKDNSRASESLQTVRQRYSMKLELVLDKSNQIIKKDFAAEDGYEKVIAQVLDSTKIDLENNNKELTVALINKDRFEANAKTLDNLSIELTQRQAKLDELSNEYSDVKLKYSSLNASIDELKKQLLYDSKNEALQKIQLYRSSLDKLNAAVVNASNKFNSLSRTVESKKGQQIAEIESEIRIKAELESAKNAYFNSIIASNFENEDAYKNAKLQSYQIEELQKNIDDYNKKLSETNQEIKIYKEQTKGKTEIALDNMMTTKKELSDALLEIEKEFKIIYTLVKKDSDARDNIEKLFEQRKKTRAQFEIYNSLNSTANGNISGKSKIDFETYIQRQYFNKIIATANNRLVKMTSNQFILQCRDLTDLGNRGPVGLDLDVYSLVTDTTRDIKTLSGGESFMAALSMALGLSDVIQATAGAVHLDTMFIDEGFGSLDDNSRSQAISILNELAGNNRLVGIISHVNELKEQIDNKLIVKKSDKGSKVNWIE